MCNINIAYYVPVPVCFKGKNVLRKNYYSCVCVCARVNDSMIALLFNGGCCGYEPKIQHLYIEAADGCSPCLASYLYLLKKKNQILKGYIIIV